MRAPLTPIAIAAAALVGGLAGGARAQTALAPAWTHTTSGVTTDGIAAGDVHPSAGPELVVVAERDGSDAAVTEGRILVLGADGTLLNTFVPPSGRQLMGLPLIEQLDTGLSEILVGEYRSATDGGVYALPGDAADATAAAWILSPRGYPGYWNMGQSAGAVRSDGSRALVVPGWDGIVQLLDPASGGVLATYDLWAQQGENIHGHVSVGDVDGTAGEEVVLVGRSTGTVYALRDDGAGGMGAIYTSSPVGGAPVGSGPAIGDIDGDGSPEIVVALRGPSVIRAYDVVNGGGACEYEWTATGAADFLWISPVIGDVDADGLNEIVVQSSDSQLSVLSTEGVTSDPLNCQEGAYQAVHQVGAGEWSWFTPALADVTGDAGLDIITASFRTLQVLDVDQSGNVTVTHQGTDSSAYFYPSATVVPGVGGARASIFVSGYSNGSVSRYDVTDTGSTDEGWSNMMRGSERTGCGPRIPATSCQQCSNGGLCEETCVDGSCSCEDGCSCAFTCVEDEACYPTCSGGSTCDIACGGTDLCEPSCIEASTCTVTCDDSNDCGLVECSGGSTCDMVCSDTTNNCKLSCDASSCDLTCTDVVNCDDVTCANGADCDVLCEDLDTCEIACESGSGCLLTCGLDTGTCEFSSCDGAEQSCGGGVIACNRPCP